MSDSNNSKPSKGKGKADEGKADESRNLDHANISTVVNTSSNRSDSGDNNDSANSNDPRETNNSGDSNSSGSTTPRATRTSAPPSNTSRYANLFPLPRGAPRPVPGIDHSNDVRAGGFSALPSRSDSSAPTAPIPVSDIFQQLQGAFTELRTEQAQIASQHNNALLMLKVTNAAQEEADDAAEKNKRDLEKNKRDLEEYQRGRHVVSGVWNAAAKVERDNEKEKQRLEGVEAGLGRREVQLETRQREFQELVGRHLEAERIAMGRTATIRHLARTSGALLESPNQMQQHSNTTSSLAVDDPPRGRTLSSSHNLEQQQHSNITSSSAVDEPPRGRTLLSSHNPEGQPVPTAPRRGDLIFRELYPEQYSPVRASPVVPRRVPSADLFTTASPPPREDAEAEAASPEGEAFSLFNDSPEEDASSPVLVQRERAGEAGRPRANTVRRVSKSDNLRDDRR